MAKSKEWKENGLWKLVEYALLVLSLVAFIVVFAANPTTTENGALDMYMVWTYILVIVGLVLALAFPLVKSFKSKKGILSLVLLIVAAVVIIGGAWLIAPGNEIAVNTTADHSTFKFADAALYVCYVFLFGSIAALIWSGVRKLIKK